MYSALQFLFRTGTPFSIQSFDGGKRKVPAFLVHDHCHHIRRCGTMGKKQCRCFCLYDRCFILLPTYRTHKGFPACNRCHHFCRVIRSSSRTNLYPRCSIRNHSRTDPFFRGTSQEISFMGRCSCRSARTDFFFW